MRKIISIIIGIACVIVGIVVMILHFNAQKTQTAETTAKIIRIDIQSEMNSDGLETRWYLPVVEYTVNNQNYEKELTNSRTASYTEYKEGESITIKYNPDNPNEISKDGEQSGLISGIIFIIAGILITIFSFFGKFNF